jgi:hypothetical protein
VEGTCPCLIWRNMSAFSWRDCEVMKNTSESSRCPTRDSKLVSPECKSEELSLEPTKSTETAASVYAHHSVTNLRVIQRIIERNILQSWTTFLNLRKGTHVAESVEGTATPRQPRRLARKISRLERPRSHGNGTILLY